MAYQTPDSKKEEFRKYLEKSGVIDALTKGAYSGQIISTRSFLQLILLLMYPLFRLPTSQQFSWACTRSPSGRRTQSTTSKGEPDAVDTR